MGRVKDLALILSNITNDGIEFGYFGSRLKEYVYEEATVGFGINRGFVQQFVEVNVNEIEEDAFNV
tara:strand:- start:34 stop:231 length:198 start_codon:yes stop_codon:yes gene_type:complete